MLPHDEGPVLALLPAVDCRYKIKSVLHARPLAAEVAPLSLLPLSQCPALLPQDSLQTVVRQQTPIILPSPPICTLPPTLLPPLARRLPIPPGRSPVAVVPLVSQHCARLGPPLLLEAETVNSSKQGKALITITQREVSVNQEAPKLLQFLPIRTQSPPVLPDLNDPVPQGGLFKKKSDLQVYVRRSPRLQKAYDGERVNPVERASRRMAAAATRSPASSASASTSSGGYGRRARSKVRKIEEVIQLPFKAKPKPTSKALIKELAQLCGLKAHDTFKEAAQVERATPGGSNHGNA